MDPPNNNNNSKDKKNNSKEQVVVNVSPKEESKGNASKSKETVHPNGKKAKPGLFVPTPNLNYSLVPVSLTVLLFSLSGSFQLGFQDVYYENSFRILQNVTLKVGQVASFDPEIGPTSTAFHLGCALGAAAMSVLYHFTEVSGSASVVGFVAGLSGACLALGYIEGMTSFLVLTCMRAVYGIGVGGAVFLQIIVINGMALEKQRSMFNLFTALSIPIGALAALFITEAPILTRDNWFVPHLMSMAPCVVTMLYSAIWFKLPPSMHIVSGRDDLAMLSAKHYYGDVFAERALAEVYEKVKIKNANPNLLTIWRDPVAVKAFALALAINAVAGMSGERFTWMYMSRFVYGQSGLGAQYYVLLAFIMFFTIMGLVFCAIFVGRVEHRTLLIVSVVMGGTLEVIFGSYCDFFGDYISKDARLTVAAFIRACLHLFFGVGVSTMSWFAILDLMFSAGNWILLALTLATRFLVMAVYPYVYHLISIHSHIAASSVSAAAYVMFAIYILAKYPRLMTMTPYQILKSFGHPASFSATKEEIANVRKNLFKLWDLADSQKRD